MRITDQQSQMCLIGNSLQFKVTNGTNMKRHSKTVLGERSGISSNEFIKLQGIDTSHD